MITAESGLQVGEKWVAAAQDHVLPKIHRMGNPTYLGVERLKAASQAFCGEARTRRFLTGEDDRGG